MHVMLPAPAAPDRRSFELWQCYAGFMLSISGTAGRMYFALHLTSRPNGAALPKVEIVDMRKELEAQKFQRYMRAGAAGAGDDGGGGDGIS